MHARANLYGLGKGVYPKGKSPWPAHPNTLSYEQVVFIDEITEEDRANQTDRISWLKGQSQQAKKAVLGHDKKVAALDKGYLKESMIATPWKHLEPALKRKGINTQTLWIPLWNDEILGSYAHVTLDIITTSVRSPEGDQAGQARSYNNEYRRENACIQGSEQ